MIRGKVAQVLDDQSLVINRGHLDGVRPGTRFAVVESAPQEIVDPDTGTSLGVVPREKIRVRAFLVEDQLAVCETYETEVLGAATFDVQDFFRPRTKRVTFEGAEYLPPLTREERIVRVGDPVREIPDQQKVNSGIPERALQAPS